MSLRYNKHSTRAYAIQRGERQDTHTRAHTAHTHRTHTRTAARVQYNDTPPLLIEFMKLPRTPIILPSVMRV